MRVSPRYVYMMPALIWLLLCSTGAYAFVHISSLPAASPARSAGAASEYRVSNIAYTLGAADPSSISGVNFTVTSSLPSARIATVRAKLISSSSTFFACVNAPAGSQRWACPISGVAVAAADQLKLDVADLSAAPGLHLYLPVMRR